MLVHGLKGAPQYNKRVAKAGVLREAAAGSGGAARVETTFRFEGQTKTVAMKPANLRVLSATAVVGGKAAEVVTSVLSGADGRLMSSKQSLNGAIGVVNKAGEYEAPKAQRSAVAARAEALKLRADLENAFAPPWPAELLAVLAPEMLRVCAIDMSVSAGNAKLDKDYYGTATRLVDAMEMLANELEDAAAAFTAIGAGGRTGSRGGTGTGVEQVQQQEEVVQITNVAFDTIAVALFGRYNTRGRMTMESFNSLGGDTRLPDFKMKLTEPMWKGVCQTIKADHTQGFTLKQFALFFGNNRGGMAGRNKQTSLGNQESARGH